MSEEQKIEIPAGMLAITTYGSIAVETTDSLAAMGRHNVAQGIKNINYAFIPGNLVDKARNDAVKVLLANKPWQYLAFIDADMQFVPQLMEQLLITAYHLTPWADVVGAWCPLRGAPYLPTIDTGTGTWESHDAGMGPVEVIRTGSACVLIKRHIYERMEFPWYGVRPAPRPVDMMAEFDNYVRCKMDGRNPFRDDDLWARIETCAREDARSQRLNAQAQGPGGFYGSVGEDSNFCDRVKALGGRIVVNTDIVANHMERRPITPADHIKAMKEAERWTRLAVGIAA